MLSSLVVWREIFEDFAGWKPGHGMTEYNTSVGSLLERRTDGNMYSGVAVWTTIGGDLPYRVGTGYSAAAAECR